MPSPGCRYYYASIYSRFHRVPTDLLLRMNIIAEQRVGFWYPFQTRPKRVNQPWNEPGDWRERRSYNHLRGAALLINGERKTQVGKITHNVCTRELRQFRNACDYLYCCMRSWAHIDRLCIFIFILCCSLHRVTQDDGLSGQEARARQ